MRAFLTVLMCVLPVLASAEIYKCTDSQGKVVYQDFKCAIKTLGTVAPPPAPSKEAQKQAWMRLDRMLEQSRYYDQKRREDMKLRQDELRLLEAQEVREKNAAPDQESVLYVPVYGRHRHRQDAPQWQDAKAQRRPCVIGYVGDRSCH